MTKFNETFYIDNTLIHECKVRNLCKTPSETYLIELKVGIYAVDIPVLKVIYQPCRD